MKVKITINADSDAFADDAPTEVVQILSNLSAEVNKKCKLEVGDVIGLIDYNGNRCGELRVVK